ncbi:hypothetical protein M8C21_033176 [Ambrosia artemisiifolia]|uniref:Amidase domain-containing protein n=1 Tax=Ambrosia artemisiifolia TaxID=4212 RepID=A0AAD5C082_AMBAR|nr:hypothetical protein M8C21_033176 [Ambrosia artemisiifolia]
MKSIVSSNPKIWMVIGVTVAGGILIIVASEAARKRRRRSRLKEDDDNYGAFMERFVLIPPPPAAKHPPLSALTFLINDVFDVKDHVTGFGNPDWKTTHDQAPTTALSVTTLLKNGATCVGKAVMDDFSFGITGENSHYGTPTNPATPSCIPGGSCSGSAVAVAADLVDFAIGTDTVGGVRIPASFCGVLGFRPSHGAVSTIGVLPISQNLDTVDLAPKHMNIGQYILSNVPSLKYFLEQTTNVQNEANTLKALSLAMQSLQRYEFKTNHEEWINTVKPRLGSNASGSVHAAITATHENIEACYMVRTEMRAALRSLLKDDGILAVPTVADTPPKLNSKKSLLSKFNDRAFSLLSIATISGCCQITVPFGKHEDCPLGVSFIANHGSDKFLLDTVLDMYQSIQGQVSAVTSLQPSLDTKGNVEASMLWKEKIFAPVLSLESLNSITALVQITCTCEGGNAAYRGKQWQKAITYYTEAVKLDEINATFYCNRAAAYLELGSLPYRFIAVASFRNRMAK